MSPPPTPQQALPSPSTLQGSRRDSVHSQLAPKSSNLNMLRINNLLNPVALNQQSDAAGSRPPTPAATTTYSYTPRATATPTPGPEFPRTPALTKQAKGGKDGGVVPRGVPKLPIKYPPYETNSTLHYHTSALRNEVASNHKRFNIRTAGADSHGLIGEYPKHIPYASEKKGFFGKTGRDAFEVLQYKFTLPGDSTNKEYTVMWDYQIGLMRMTPFFKACGFQKTTPAKALKYNNGLIELCHSITGGALSAQGYWVPFACARAVCLTFCWDIRWVLTPIFGPSFVTECLEPGDPGYKHFRIDPNIISNAAAEAENWKLLASRSVTPASRSTPPTYGAGDDPRPLPPTSAPTPTPGQQQRRKKRPSNPSVFKEGSPFSSHNQQAYHRAAGRTITNEDEAISPKSSPRAAPFPPAMAGWTSINRLGMPPPPSNNTPVGAPGFRDLDGQRSPSPANLPAFPQNIAAFAVREDHHHSRPPWEREREDADNANVVTSDSESNDDDASTFENDSNVVTSSPPAKARVAKRTRSPPSDDDEEYDDDMASSGDDEDDAPPSAKRTRAMSFNSDDMQAARTLVALMDEDRQIAFLRP